MPYLYLTTDSKRCGRSLWGGAILLAILIVGCKEPRIESRKGTYPVESIEIIGESQFIQLHSEANLADVINMDLFEPFWPGITAEEALEVAGEPARTAMKAIVPPDERRGDFYYYDKGVAEIRISRVMSGSGGMPSLVSWDLFLFPKPNSGGTILSEYIAKLTDSRVRELFVEAPGESLHVVVKNGVVMYVVWHKE